MLTTTSLTLLLLNALSTWFMFGLIWYVQIVHYPLFYLIGKENFVTYQERFQWRTSLVVGAPMLIEAFSSVLLLWYPPIEDYTLLLMGVGLIFVIWISTAFLQIPCHGELSRGYQPVYHRRLVLSNWVRTISWTLRAVLMAWILFTMMAGPLTVTE
ncbi:MAG: hypothetical protein VYE64_06495 [Planctomycetota bacterium]|nr:hypothetical protein [Planctomycetota bacterium]